MTPLRIVPFPADVADAARTTMADAWGERVTVWPAAERHVPCRSCMHDTRLGDDVLLLKFTPFAAASPSPYAERGPIFLCGRACTPFHGEGQLPPIVTSRQVNIRAYDKRDFMLYAHSQLADGREAERIVARLIEDPEVHQVHIRTALHGCFLCAVWRGP